MSLVKSLAIAGGLALGVAGCHMAQDPLFESNNLSQKKLKSAIILRSDVGECHLHMNITESPGCSYYLYANNRGVVLYSNRDCNSLAETPEGENIGKIKYPQQVFDEYIKLIKHPLEDKLPEDPEYTWFKDGSYGVVNK